MAQKSEFCNTKDRTRSRVWSFTLNNYSEDEIKNIQSLDCQYTFQEEKGEMGTPHLQGMLCFKNPQEFKRVKNLIPRAHLEIARKKNALFKYCMKEDTRNGAIYTNMEEVKKNGTKAQIKKGENFDKILKEDIWKNFEVPFEEMDEIRTYNIFDKPFACAFGCCGICECEEEEKK